MAQHVLVVVGTALFVQLVVGNDFVVVVNDNVVDDYDLLL